MDEVAELSRRVREDVLRVVVAGEAKRGKSTLINALLARAVLPTGVVPLTAVPTTLGYGESEAVEVRYTDGRDAVLGLDALPELVTEAGNPANRGGVAAVTVRLPAPLLAGGMELVDTPGTGSVYVHNTTAAAGALERMDAAVFVLTVDPPISETERVFLRRVRDESVALFCVLNKVDYLTPAEQGQALEFTCRVVAEELGQDRAVWPVSARTALAGRLSGNGPEVAASGLPAFEDAFTGYLHAYRAADLARSVSGRAARLARGVAEEAAATLAALELSAAELEDRLAQFRDRLVAVEQERRDSAALARAEISWLLSETNAQAAALPGQAGPAVVQRALTGLDRGAAPLAAAERAGLQQAAAEIRQVVEDWRERRGAELEAAIAALDDRLARRLDEQVATVRRAARELFAVGLGELATTERLVASTRFHYAFGTDPGQVEALAAAVRTRLPGGLGRRRVERYVAERTTELLDQQTGRARADFQDRLTETLRHLARQLDQRFTVGAGRIGAAVERAALLRAEQQEGTARVRTALEGRVAAAGRLAAEFDGVTASGRGR